MVIRRILTVAWVVSLAAIIGIAVWLRTSSLEGAPWHAGDESYYGVQTWRLIHGQSFCIRTMSGNIIDPFIMLMQIPLYAVASPSAWVLKVPSVVSGLLAVFLLYILGSRALDRPTAGLAAVMLMTLPNVIVFSRFGVEPSQIPVVGVIAAYFALRGHGLGLLATILTGLIVHPTNILLVPILMPTLLVRIAGQSSGDFRYLRRSLLTIMGVTGAVGGVVVPLLLMHPTVKVYLIERTANCWSLDWSGFLGDFARFWTRGPLPGLTPEEHARVFWIAAVALLSAGGWRLTRARCWDRLALIGGTAAGVTALHVLAGSDMFVKVDRYASVLIIPMILSFACLVRAATDALNLGQYSFATPARQGLMVVLGCGLLFCADRNFFRPAGAGTGESIWTFHTEVKDPFRCLLRLIRRDLACRNAAHPGDRAGAPRRLVIAQDYFVYMPLVYLARSRPDVEFVELLNPSFLGQPLIREPKDTRLCEQLLGDQLRAGNYVVSEDRCPPWNGAELIASVAKKVAPPGRLQSWTFPGGPKLVVYRLTDEQVALRTPGGDPSLRR